MSRSFGQVASTLDQSEKWWALKTDRARLAYTWLHWNRHATLTGLYTMPAVFMAHYLHMSADEANDVLDDIASVGLIDRHGDLIRLCGLYKAIPPYNQSTIISACHAFEDERAIPPGQLRARAMVELVEASFRRGEEFNPNADLTDKMWKTLMTMMNREQRKRQASLSEAYYHLRLHESDTVSDTVSTWCGHRDMERNNEREMERDSEMEMERERDRSSARARAKGGTETPPPASPADRRRSGPSRPTLDSEIAKRARGEK